MDIASGGDNWQQGGGLGRTRTQTEEETQARMEGKGRERRRTTHPTAHPAAPSAGVGRNAVDKAARYHPPGADTDTDK